MKYKYWTPIGKIEDCDKFKREIIRAKDQYLFDNNNKKFLDLRSGLWNVNFGNEENFLLKLKDSFDDLFRDKIIYSDISSFRHPLYQEYAEKLLAFVDSKNFSRLVYTNSGSECTELSLKFVSLLQRQIGKDRILAFSKGYHGTFWGGMSVSGIDKDITNVYKTSLGNIDFIDFPDSPENEEALIQYILKNSSRYCAMIIEPVLASAGIKIMRDTFMNKLGILLKEKEIAIVFDEVATGFFRTGKKFYFNKLNFTPDFVHFSKGINNGTIPFGVVLISNEIEKKLDGKYLEHFSTQNGNLLGVASANVSLDYYNEHERSIVANIAHYQELFPEELKLQGVRTIGCMTGIPIDNYRKLGLISNELEQNGILTYMYTNDAEDNGLTLMPSFFLKKDQLRNALAKINRVVQAYD